MVKCSYCGEDVEGLPYKCKYCGGVFCVWHHLPEEHECREVHKAINLRTLERNDTLLKATGRVALYELKQSVFKTRELRDLAIGVTAVVLAWAYPFNIFSLISALLVTLVAYLPHELAHKFVAEHYGCSARYVLSPWGLVLTLLSVLPVFPIRFIMPGYVLVESWGLSAKSLGVISAAGPLVNIASAAVLLVLAPSWPITRTLVYANALIAVFNLIPLGDLDGRKIAGWSLPAWLVMFAFSILLFVIVG